MMRSRVPRSRRAMRCGAAIFGCSPTRCASRTPCNAAKACSGFLVILRVRRTCCPPALRRSRGNIAAAASAGTRFIFSPSPRSAMPRAKQKASAPSSRTWRRDRCPTSTLLRRRLRRVVTENDHRIHLRQLPAFLRAVLKNDRGLTRAVETRGDDAHAVERDRKIHTAGANAHARHPHLLLFFVAERLCIVGDKNDEIALLVGHRPQRLTEIVIVIDARLETEQFGVRILRARVRTPN